MRPMTPDQQELVNANLNLAYYFSHQWQAPRGMCQADWTAECWYYLTVAAIKFDPAQSNNFPGYATKVMQNGWKACQGYLTFKCRDVARVVACSHEVDVVDHRQVAKEHSVAQAKALAEKVIGSLPTSYQDVVRLRMHGRSFTQIGKLFGYSRETARMRFELAKDYLRFRWDGQLND
jgi:RNA polymerase sigma factor (sigma-70 family)